MNYIDFLFSSMISVKKRPDLCTFNPSRPQLNVFLVGLLGHGRYVGSGVGGKCLPNRTFLPCIIRKLPML